MKHIIYISIIQELIKLQEMVFNDLETSVTKDNYVAKKHAAFRRFLDKCKKASENFKDHFLTWNYVFFEPNSYKKTKDDKDLVLERYLHEPINLCEVKRRQQFKDAMLVEAWIMKLNGSLTKDNLTVASLYMYDAYGMNYFRKMDPEKEIDFTHYTWTQDSYPTWYMIQNLLDDIDTIFKFVTSHSYSPSYIPKFYYKNLKHKISFKKISKDEFLSFINMNLSYTENCTIFCTMTGLSPYYFKKYKKEYGVNFTVRKKPVRNNTTEETHKHKTNEPPVWFENTISKDAWTDNTPEEILSMLNDSIAEWNKDVCREFLNVESVAKIKEKHMEGINMVKQMLGIEESLPEEEYDENNENENEVEEEFNNKLDEATIDSEFYIENVVKPYKLQDVVDKIKNIHTQEDVDKVENLLEFEYYDEVFDKICPEECTDMEESIARDKTVRFLRPLYDEIETRANKIFFNNITPKEKEELNKKVVSLAKDKPLDFDFGDSSVKLNTNLDCCMKI